MYIFIDETGSFSGVGQFPSPSVVGALVIPDGKLAEIEKRYARIRTSLPKERDEVKGRLLSETDVARVVAILRRNEALFEATMIDLGAHTDVGLQHHKTMQAEGFTRNLTEQHHSTVHDEIRRLRHQLEVMGLPLYVQSILTFDVVYTVLKHSTLYYCQRRPQELGFFHWIIDAKGAMSTPTPWELWWSQVVMPMLQARSLRQPIPQLLGGDYSYFKRFEGEVPDHLKPLTKNTDASPMNLRPLLTESFRFANCPEAGLELVDIITNAVRRALKGNLAAPGWSEIRRLMIHRKSHYIRAVTLEDDANLQHRQYPYLAVLQAFSSGGRNIVPR
jgi:hypothetical protein